MMSPPLSATAAAMLLLLGGAGGHMIMNTPTPYNLDIAPLLQVDPISSPQYPFPCHNQYGFTTRTTVEAGSMTLVNFTGGGQHGGGSCQFSITYDEPINGGNWNKSASFKTIYSIIGGCPAVFTNEGHNLAPAPADRHHRQDGNHCGNDSGIDCIREFMIPIPKFLKNGPATFAWTWFNKLGNKEMYMNCAPINITGGTGDEKEIATLPDIFVANYHNDVEVPNCITGTSGDKVVVNFPNPGKYGRVLAPPVEPEIKPSGYCANIPPALSLPTFETSSQTAGADGSNITATVCSSDAASSTPSPPAITPTSGESSSAATAPPGTETTTTAMVLPTTNIPITETRSDGTNTTAPRLSTTTPHSISFPTTLTTTISESTSTSLAPPTGSHPVVNKPSDKAVACPTHGELVCLDNGMFGICNWGWAIPQEVAAGTQCKDGTIVKRNGGGDYGDGWK